MLVASLILGAQVQKEFPYDYANRGIFSFDYIERADKRGLPDPNEFENATTSIRVIYYLLSDTNDISPNEDGTKTRGKLELTDIVKETGFQAPSSFTYPANTNGAFPDKLFTHISNEESSINQLTKQRSTAIINERTFKADEREVVFACIIMMYKSERRLLNHLLYSRGYIAKSLTFKTFTTTQNTWINPYSENIVNRNHINPEPKWPHAQTSELPNLLDAFGGPPRQN